MKKYSRQDLIREVLRKYGGRSYQILPTQPLGQYVSCIACQHRTVLINTERYGDGTEDYINWVADVWVGLCRRKECACLNLWIELTEQDEIDRENRRRLVALCDKQLKSL